MSEVLEKASVPAETKLATVAIGQKCRRLAGQTYDCLSRVADDFYGDPLLWPVLYDYPKNRQVVRDNPNVVKAGQPIAVPDIGNLTAADREAIRTRGRNWQQFN